MPERRATDGPRRHRAGQATGHASPPAGRSAGTRGGAAGRDRWRSGARVRDACPRHRAPRGWRSNREGPAPPVSVLCPEVAVLVGCTRPGGPATESSREREEGAFERQERDVFRLHGAKGTDQLADGAGGDATAAAELDARQLLAPEEAPDRTLRDAELACRFGRCQPSGRHRVDPYQPVKPDQARARARHVDHERRIELREARCPYRLSSLTLPCQGAGRGGTVAGA